MRILNKKASLVLSFLFLCCFLSNDTLAESPQAIPYRPCDFYGTELAPNAIKVGSIITAQDPNGAAIGQFTVTASGQYGFLSTRALDGDIITFYIDGVKQQKQAVWQSGATIRVDLGVAALENAFNLHLTDMPGYTNYQDNPDYSAVAVADMIIDYLVPANTDTQAALMSSADLNKDGVLSSLELEKLLNQKVGRGYNFGSTTTINQYSSLGFIDQFNAANQADCIKQICHWLAYKVPNVTADKEYVPVAIATSANPAVKADSDYRHWMSVVGVKTNQDPFPNLPTAASVSQEYHVSNSLQLYGVYLNDPSQSGLGFHTYMAADIWSTQYFRPIASGLEGAGTYAAIMEPPDPKAASVKLIPSKENNQLQAVLEIPEKGISVFIPKSLNKRVKDYLAVLLKRLKRSPDFSTLTEDKYFSEALKNTQVNRAFKVASKDNQDYTVIPFEKRVNNKLTTSLAVIVNNATGAFQMASADNKAADIYSPMPWYEAYKALRKQIGWAEYPVKFWLSNSSGSALFPGWSVLTLKYSRQGPVGILNTNEYNITAQRQIGLVDSSPKVEILSTEIFYTGKEWAKLVQFKVTCVEKYIVEADKNNMVGKISILQNQNDWLVVLTGPQDSSCNIEVKGEYSTYLYIRK